MEYSLAKNETHAVSLFSVSCSRGESMDACRLVRAEAVFVASVAFAARGIIAVREDERAGNWFSGAVRGIVFGKSPTAIMKALLCTHTQHNGTTCHAIR